MSLNSATPRTFKYIPLKLRPPAPGPGFVLRDDFCRKAAESRANLILVSAPAGYGKTTALAQLYAQLTESSTATSWLTLEQSENDLGRFAHYLWHAFSIALPNQIHETFEAAAIEEASASGSGLAYELQALITTTDTPFTIFIDEFECITSTETLTFINNLVHGLHDGQRLVIGSRHKTSLPLGKLRVQGRLMELEASDLKFSREETRRFVQNQLTTELAESDLTDLQEKTDGWAAALQLTTTALKGQSNPSSVLQNLAGPSRGIADYLAEDVLQQLPEQQRTFLVQSSIFQSFCPILCNHVFGRSDCNDLISKTNKDNLFLQTIDAECEWYRYHPLFREFLQSQVHKLPNAELETQVWHKRAAEWLDQAGRGIQAVKHALVSNNLELAAKLMSTRAADFVRTGQFGIVSNWIESLPSSVIQDHIPLAIAGAYAMVFLHRYQEANVLLEFIKPAVSKENHLAYDLLVLEVMLDAWSDNLPKAMETASQAAPNLNDASPYVVGLTRNAAAYHEISLGKYFEALQHLKIAKHALEPIKAIHGLVYSQCFEGAIEMLHGNVIQASARFNGILNNTITSGYRFTNSTAVTAAYLIEALYEQNELDSVESLLTDYTSLIRDCCLPDQLIVTYRIASRILFIRGRQSEALETLDHLQDLGDLRGIPRLAAAARQGKLRLALRAGDIVAAKRLYTLLSSQEIWQPWDGYLTYGDDLDDPFIAHVRISLVSGNGSGVIGELQEAIINAERHNRYRRAIRLRCLLAQALDAARRRSQAVDLLEKTLEQAYQKGLFRIIADDSWHLMPLLETLELRCRTIPIDYITKLIKASAETNVAYLPSTPSSVSKATEGNLSQREMQILRLVSEGCSNKELSRKLFVSENTVETHLRRIYSKLGSKNRTQAVSKAREMNII